MTDEHVAVLRIAAARLFAEFGERETNGTLTPIAAGHRDRLGEVIAFLSHGAVASLAMDRLDDPASLPQ